VRRILLWLLPPAVALGAWLGVARARDLAAIQAAAGQLAAGDLARARAGFLVLAGSPWVGTAARAGDGVVRALLGEPQVAAAMAPEDLRRFPLRHLMEQALAGRSFAGCAALARLAERAGEPAAPVYLAAALLETGQPDAARRALESAAIGASAHGLARDVARTLELHAGSRTVVRDAAGQLAGVLDSSGTLDLLDETTRAWVPVPDLSGLSAEPGLRLSVDLELSRLAEEALAGYRGSVVLVDTTGAVLSAVSDPRTRREGGIPAFEQRREPASIAKIITTSAALRAGLDPDAEISRMTCTGSQHYEGGTLWCARAGGQLGGLDQAMATSCNTAFANLALRVGRAAVVEEFRRFGFDADRLGAGRIKAPDGDDRQLADLSIGLEATDITPLHAALLAAVVANDGSLPEPRLVTATDGVLGRSPRATPHPPGRRVIEPAWVPTLRRSMEAAVRPGGTAAGLGTPTFPVAMKTGTAAEWRRGYHVNYIGFGPLPDARVAFCVRVTHQPSSWRAARAGREVTAAVLDALQRRWPALSRTWVAR
jgi:hypothetical protein